MRVKEVLASSAIVMSVALVFSLLLNLSGYFPEDILVPKIRGNLTVLVLAVMLTISLSRIPYKNLDPIKNSRSVTRAFLLGSIVAAAIPIAGYLLMKDTSWGAYSIGLIFVAAAPFAASVAPLSYILRGDMEHAARGTIIVYAASLLWIPFVIYITLGKTVDMTGVVITVLEIIGVPLVLSRLLTKVKIGRDTMSIMMNLFISFLVILSVSSTNFPREFAPLLLFIIIAGLRTFVLGTGVEYAEKKAGINWHQRVTDVLMASYRNKGVAITMCAATMGPAAGTAMVAIATSIVVEICWVIFMDSVMFSKKRMKKEIGSEISDA
ncbi:MAG: bile acid:Na+ symporter, family [Candidatus Methanomethylophilaceae archaeon]|nr:bile acid:Na+ symporter, family [Candidatus Methanomethylophilaceae archaeon]